MSVNKWMVPALVVAFGLSITATQAVEPKAAPAKKAAKGEKAAKETKPEQPLEVKLPPGWTAEDMQACILAGTPGKMQQHLAKEAGAWQGKTTMWMAPEGESMESECTSTVTTIMDGRFTQVVIDGEMPGMGPYKGLGTYGFDNVSQKFVSTWIDNHGTGIMTGQGELSKDGKTMTWNYSFNCPLTKKMAKMREVEQVTGPDTKTLEMFGADPKTGKEFKMMRIEFTKSKDDTASDKTDDKPAE